jgi:arabinose-5-phosphate isomerase
MSESWLEIGQNAILQEAGALSSLADCLDENFSLACELLVHCSGTVVLTGMGKSGLVARKWASTFMSTGTRAYFLSPAEASHGDLGLLREGDILVALSASGETEELRPVIQYAQENRVPYIAVTQNSHSSLAKTASVVLPVEVKAEACPLGLAPTTSTTLMMALGDAVAIVLMRRKGFSEKDFARLHPGGSLGRRLYLRVSSLMHTGEKIPVVAKETPLVEVLLEMTRKCLGLAVVMDESEIYGVITDGDLRRAFQSRGMDERLRAKDVSTLSPKRIQESALAVQAAEQMAQHSVQQLLVDDKNGRLVGVVHLFDLLRAKVT